MLSTFLNWQVVIQAFQSIPYDGNMFYSIFRKSNMIEISYIFNFKRCGDVKFTNTSSIQFVFVSCYQKILVIMHVVNNYFILTLKSMHNVKLITLKLMYNIYLVTSIINQHLHWNQCI